MISSDNKITLKNIYDIYLSIKNKDIDKLIKYIEDLIKNRKIKYNYLNNLLNPEIYKYVKIPSFMPIPTCSFQLYNSAKVQTSYDGYFGFVVNPFFLYNDAINLYNTVGNGKYYTLNGKDKQYEAEIIQSSIDDPYTRPYRHWYSIDYMSSCLFINQDDWKGENWGFYWNTFDFKQGVNPMFMDFLNKNHGGGSIDVNDQLNILPLYSQYRLVSACIKVKYLGNINEASGIIGGSIILENDKKLYPKFTYIEYSPHAGEGAYTVTVDTYSDETNRLDYFDKMKHAYYHKENSCLDGLKMIYFPTDNSCEQFYHVLGFNDFIYDYNLSMESKSPFIGKNYNNNFKFYVYVKNGPPTTDYQIDLYCNFECIPESKYLNFISSNTDTMNITNEEKKEMINILQQKPIMKFDENITYDDKNDWENNIKDIMK